MAKKKITTYNPDTESISASKPYKAAGRTFLYAVITITNLLTGRQRDLKRSTGVRIDEDRWESKANQAIDRILAEYQPVGTEPSALLTVKDYSITYIDDRTAEGISASSVRGMQAAFRSLIIFVGASKLLLNITAMDVRRFLFQYQRSGSVAVSFYRYLHAAFARAVRDGLLATNVFDQVDTAALRKRFKPKPRGILTPPEVLQLYQAYPKETFIDRSQRNFILLLFGAGLRRGEGCFLRIDHIDLTGRIIKIRSTEEHTLKTAASEADLPFNRYSEFAIRDQLRNLAEHPNEAIRESAFLFPNRFGRPYNPETLTRAIIKQARNVFRQLAINAPGFDIHSLRHSIIQWLIDSGAEPAIVAKFARHKNLQTTLSSYHRTEDITTKFESVLRITNAMPAIIEERQATEHHHLFIFGHSALHLMVTHHGASRGSSESGYGRMKHRLYIDATVLKMMSR